MVGESGLDYKPLVFPPSDLAALQVRQVSGGTGQRLRHPAVAPEDRGRQPRQRRGRPLPARAARRSGPVHPAPGEDQQGPLPAFDPDGRLFVAFDDPVPENEAEKRENRKLEPPVRVQTINEVREEDGLDPVPWGDEPILPITVAPLSDREARSSPAGRPQGVGRRRSAGAAESQAGCSRDFTPPRRGPPAARLDAGPLRATLARGRPAARPQPPTSAGSGLDRTARPPASPRRSSG
jgi:hypothetical protein